MTRLFEDRQRRQWEAARALLSRESSARGRPELAVACPPGSVYSPPAGQGEVGARPAMPRRVWE